jgi:hypothetical protein
MKRIILILLTASLLGGCISSKGYLNRGRYDDAVKKASHKLRKKPEKIKEIQVLEQAYRIANERDLDRITFLKRSGQPDIWEEVFDRYNNLKYRQDIVKTLPPAILSAVNFSPVDYDADIIESQKKAAEFFYARAVSLLGTNDRFSARKAYDDLMKVKQFYSSYKDMDKLINQAIAVGTSQVLFKMKNLAPVVLPAGFEEELLKISLNSVDSRWINFDVNEVHGRSYDFFVLLNIKVIDVSPERLRERIWTESREVEDGWQYLLDANGNVVKDSLGNDIKIKKFKTITCEILETQLSKTAIVAGVMDFVDNTSNKLMKTEPVTATANFDHVFLLARGDLNALKNETAQRLGQPVPFPADLDMIMLANDILKDAAKRLINANKYRFK